MLCLCIVEDSLIRLTGACVCVCVCVRAGVCEGCASLNQCGVFRKEFFQNKMLTKVVRANRETANLWQRQHHITEG